MNLKDIDQTDVTFLIEIKGHASEFVRGFSKLLKLALLVFSYCLNMRMS